MTTRVDITTVHGIRDLLSLLENDTEIILTDMNEAVAKLLPAKQANLPNNQRVADLHPGVWIRDDFDEFLPRKFWEDKL